MVQLSRLEDDAVVLAARAGDRDALNELARRHLPMVYNLVRQALHDDPDVDDVVQDVMARALRQLPDLRAPASFRPWLAAIAVRQVGSHLARARMHDRRRAPLTEATGLPDPEADVEAPALLRAEAAGQRRQVRHATCWLDAGERAVFALWWLELVGELSRAEVATGLGVSVAHAGVRVQRMREHLESGRRVVAALEAMPGCEALDGVVARWDGTPGPYWRKRIERHVRSCPVCLPAGDELVPADRLLSGLALLPLPLALTGVLLAKALAGGTAAGANVAAVAGAATWLGRTLQLVAAHPVAATVSASVLAVGITVPATGWTPSPPDHAVAVDLRPRSAPPAPPSSPPVRLTAGRVSLESVAVPGRFLTVTDDWSVLTPVGKVSDPVARRRATLTVVAGLADPACISFRLPDGRYLRHSLYRLRSSAHEGNELFRDDATFCVRAGFRAGAVSLESVNYPGFFLCRAGDEVRIRPPDGTAAFRAAGSFLVRPPLAGA